ncbi:MAG TPA: hypothetical protein PLR99_27685 [Polyangiaceae bacterium]|jgi:hypothetical protein|nr:hypothetical protein [Polyangiaceae bacterium]
MARDDERETTIGTSGMSGGTGLGGVLDGDEVQGVLSGAFYTNDSPSPRRETAAADKPQHYKVICISLYTKDLARLDAMVDDLKQQGVTKANRSALIRAALDQVDLARVPRGM